MNKWQLIYESEQPISKEEENQMYQEHLKELKEQQEWEDALQEMSDTFQFCLTDKQIKMLVDNHIITEEGYREIMKGVEK